MITFTHKYLCNCQKMLMIIFLNLNTVVLLSFPPQTALM